jgi:thymidylate synthase (FAD)
MKIVQPSVELIWITPDAAKAIEMGARVCYKSEDKYDPARTPAFLDKICNQYHHESVIEHAVASFHIICDRGVTHELVRHRLASFSQESTRYCNYGKDKYGGEISVILPPGLDQQQRLTWEEGIKAAEEAYINLLAQGQSPQIARSVLPTCLKTEIRMTANFREWLHVIKLRTANSAHPQIREIILNVQGILQRECPEIFGTQPF